jgi:5,10-methylene-tetrahydrofolate dehydrogenase/methenyl tetrahydrofolate cyclohydrolase
MFDFIKALFGVKTMPSPKTVKTVQEVAEKLVEPVIQETLKITEGNLRSKEVAPVPKPKRYTKKQLTEMTKKEVDELGLELFNIKLDRRVQKQILIQEFMDTQRDFHKKK